MYCSHGICNHARQPLVSLYAVTMNGTPTLYALPTERYDMHVLVYSGTHFPPRTRNKSTIYQCPYCEPERFSVLRVVPWYSRTLHSSRPYDLLVVCSALLSLTLAGMHCFATCKHNCLAKLLGERIFSQLCRRPESLPSFVLSFICRPSSRNARPPLVLTY